MDITFTSVKPGTDDEAGDADALPRVGEVLESMYGGLDQIPVPAPLTSGSGPVLQSCLPLLMKQLPAEALIERVGREKYEQLRSLYQLTSLLNLWYSWE